MRRNERRNLALEKRSMPRRWMLGLRNVIETNLLSSLLNIINDGTWITGEKPFPWH